MYNIVAMGPTIVGIQFVVCSCRVSGYAGAIPCMQAVIAYTVHRLIYRIVSHACAVKVYIFILLEWNVKPNGSNSIVKAIIPANTQ